MSTIAAGTTSGTALVQSGDTTGQLVLQTNGTTTAVTIGTNQVVTLAQPLPVASGGTGSASGLNLATSATGTLPVANGGTGATSLTANNVILGNGTSAVQFVAPGTNGNVLTSNGTTWTSAAAPAAGYTLATPVNASGNSVTFTGIPSGVKSVIVILRNIWMSSGPVLIQLGTSGGIVTINYASASLRHVGSGSHGSYVTRTDSFVMDPQDPNGGLTGIYQLTLSDASTNYWVGTGLANANASNSGFFTGNGDCLLSGALTQVQIKLTGGQTFAAGVLNIMYL